MIITCPECLTKFALDENRIPEGGAKARCSRCQHVFEVLRPAPPEKPSPPVKAPPKERLPSRFPLLTFLIAILILAGAGFGAFFLWERADDLKKAGLSFSALRQYLGLRNEAEGVIALEKVRGYYIENALLARIFVIEGQAVNQWREARSFIKVKGALLDAKGTKVKEKEAYCGNILSEKDLRELPLAAIEKSLSSQFGESFSNVNIPPQKSVPFMIVFPDLSLGRPEVKPAGRTGQVPPLLSEFTVEVVSSQKGSK